MEKSEPNKTEKLFIPCFLCGNGCEIKSSKKNKPYFICAPCGIQVFIRQSKGINLFNSLVKNINKSTIINFEGNNAPFELIALINNLVQLKEKVEEIEEKKGFLGALFSDQKGLDLAQKVLLKEIDIIEAKLDKFKNK